MGNNITIIGLGEIGSSIAMALTKTESDFNVIGSDYAKSVESYAQEQHFVSEVRHNYFEAVKDADLVILAVPTDQTRAILELCGHDFKENTVVLDCCPAKHTADAWAKQYMDHPENFLGIWFGMNPAYFKEFSSGAKTGHPDLFKGASLFIAADTDTSEKAIETAANLAGMLGMEASFTDALELDGMIAAAYQLPAMAANAMLGSLNKRTGWKDGKKAPGKTFYRSVSMISEKTDQEQTGAMYLNNRENTIRVLNEYINVLTGYRDALKAKDEASLRTMLEDNRNALTQWEKDYRKSNASEGGPEPIRMSAADAVSQTFFGGFLRKKMKN